LNAALVPFTPSYEQLRVIEADPAIVEYEDARYVPFRDWAVEGDPEWGLYDRDGGLISMAAYCRGPERSLVGQSRQCLLAAEAFEQGPPGPLIYAGPLIFHYGHFLLDTLPRLWPYRGPSADRFAWISPARLEILEHTPHIGACLAGLGLHAEQFLRFERPTRIPKLTVVAPAFEEGHFAHLAFRRQCVRIGERLVAEWDRAKRGPVYLARTGLASGVKAVANEDAVCAVLAGLGVEIIRPETLSLADQIGLFGSDRVIMGVAGSAFHTCMFAPPRARLIAIELGPCENQVLLNRLSGAQMLHVRPGEAVPSAPGGAIETVYTFPDPVAVARDLLRLAQSW
jgi:capsular polysaccharide biosynthesis protein